jgi:hypothetical protein
MDNMKNVTGESNMFFTTHEKSLGDATVGGRIVMEVKMTEVSIQQIQINANSPERGEKIEN